MMSEPREFFLHHEREPQLFHRIPGGKQDQNAKVQNSKAKVLKKRLQDLLAQPLMARGVSAKFITSGARPVVDDLIRGQSKSLA